ncbi:MAG: hypothetical protein ACR65T_02200 [Methylocystis sp.]|uniref:hypothetical protein n=1 Tax=Methylocystis sp. TaxID=1911079 RepID=UPI003DA6A9C8
MTQQGSMRWQLHDKAVRRPAFSEIGELRMTKNVSEHSKSSNTDFQFIGYCNLNILNRLTRDGVAQ